MIPTAWRPLGELRGRPAGSDEPLVLHLYAVTDWIGAPRNRLPEEHEEVAWFAVEDACRLELAHPPTRRPSVERLERVTMPANRWVAAGGAILAACRRLAVPGAASRAGAAKREGE